MFRKFRIPALGWVTLATFLIARPIAADEQEAAEAGINILARGPVHEAFAQPTTIAPDAGPLVTEAPPDPVPEEPPDQKPDGPNVQWISGYWSWDADQTG